MISKTSSTFVFSFMPKDVNFSNAKSNEPEGSLGKQNADVFLGAFLFINLGEKSKWESKRNQSRYQFPSYFLVT